MKKAITIRIPEPCHEDWNQMTSTDKGKFCSVCTKEVFDFTKVTDEELVKRVHNNEKICGRFKSSQINREMKFERKSGFSLAPFAASFLLPFTLLASTKTNTNTKDSNLQGNSYSSLNISSLNRTDTEKMQITTQGKIADENGKPLVNVKISVKGSDKKEISGLKGDYFIRSANDEILVIKKEGFISQEIKLKRKSETINMVLKKEVRVLVNGIISDHDVEIKPTIKDSVITKKTDSLKITIKGNVVDDSGLPLPGVNIIVKGTKNGTQTDFDGNYNIIINKNETLVFSYIGFETEEITLSNINNTIDLKMQMSEEMSGEVIVVLGGVSADYSNEIMGYKKNSYDSEPTEWRKKSQTSMDNEKEYSRIKRESKKEERKQKRNKN